MIKSIHSFFKLDELFQLGHSTVIKSCFVLSSFVFGTHFSLASQTLMEPLQTRYDFGVQQSLFNEKQLQRIQSAIEDNNLKRANRIVSRILIRKHGEIPVNNNQLCQSKSEQNSLSACIQTEQVGIIRVSFQRLLEQGVDLTGTPLSDIVVTHQGQALPIFLFSKSIDQTFDSSSYIEFLSKTVESRYTDKQVYQIYSKHSVLESPAIPTQKNTEPSIPQTSYSKTISLHQNLSYNRSYPFHYGWLGGDHNKFIMGLNSTSLTINLPSIPLTTGGNCQLDFSIYTETFTPTTANTSITLKLDEVDLSLPISHNVSNQATSYSVPFACDLLTPSSQLDLHISNLNQDNIVASIGDLSFSYETTITSNGYEAEFTSDGFSRSFSVGNFYEKPISIMRTIAGQTIKTKTRPQLDAAGNYSVDIHMSDANTSQFNIFSYSAMNNYLVLPAKAYSNITAGFADYLVISHSDFIDTDILNQHLDFRRLNHQVHAVSVTDVYAQYGYGIINPDAIKNFIQTMHESAGTSMVLLVGDDTFDYKNHLGENRVSYIPSIYNQLQRHAPIDRDYVDFDGDALPELGIGRWPVESLDELNTIVSKTRNYDPSSYLKTVTIGANYTNGSGPSNANAIAQNFPSDWTKHIIAVSTDNNAIAVETARQQLIEKIDVGSVLTVYFGHNFGAGGTLLNTDQISLLSNQNKPTVSIMIDSYTGYYVDDTVSPRQGMHAENQLLAEGIGSVASFAPSGLTGYDRLQRNLMLYITALPGWTLGEIYQGAISRNSSLTRSYNLFGDPALVINP